MKQWIQRCALLLAMMLGMLSGSAVAADSTVGQYGMLPVYGFDIRGGAYSVTIETDCELLQDALADITVTDGKITAKLLPASSRLTAISIEDAGQESSAIQPDQDGIFTLSVKAMDTAISLSVYDEQKQEWQHGSVLFRADSLPADALLVDLPDYNLIEQAIDQYQGNASETRQNATPVEAVSVDLPDGEYSVSAELTGGSGKAYVATPTLMTVRDGKAYARLEWSSSNYDYMIVGTETYYNLAEEGRNSVFEIPIGCWDTKMSVIADTTAMGTPHEVQYDITFYEASIGDKGQLPQEGAKRVVIVALVIIIVGGILNHIVKKKRRV